MAVAGVILIGLAVLILYEEIKGGFPASVASAASSSDTSQSSVPSAPTSTGSFSPSGSNPLSSLPQSWLAALAANESTLPPPGVSGPAPAFGISGPGPAGSQVFTSQAYPYHTPPLALFNTMEEAVNALGNLLNQPRYQSALSYGQQHPNDCLGFFTMLGNAGYASATDMAAGWPGQVCGRVH